MSDEILTTICFGIPPSQLVRVEKVVDRGMFPSRAEFLRFAVYLMLRDIQDIETKYAEYLIYAPD